MCLQIYLISIPETLIQGEKQTSPETKDGSIKHSNYKGRYNLLIRVYMPNIQLDNLHSLSYILFLAIVRISYYLSPFSREENYI